MVMIMVVVLITASCATSWPLSLAYAQAQNFVLTVVTTDFSGNQINGFYTHSIAKRQLGFF
jgi:hypothetical protein